MIEIIGKKHLNSNFYKSISVKQMDGYIRIKAVVDEKFKNAELIKLDTFVITEQINGLSDYDKIKEIVLYFLRNNTICEIVQENDKIVVSSTSFRKLVLQLSNEYNDLLNLVIKKYQIDRLQFMKDCDADDIYIQSIHLDNFKIVTGTTNYYEGIDFKKRKALVLTLACSNKSIASLDNKFIIEYINNLLNSSEQEILYYRDQTGGHLHCCGKCIRIPQHLCDEISSFVINRNYEISKMNGRQYKLEGIK